MYVLGLLISPEICLDQHFFGLKNIWYVLIKADFRSLYFFRKFSMFLYKFKLCIFCNWDCRVCARARLSSSARARCRECPWHQGRPKNMKKNICLHLQQFVWHHMLENWQRCRAWTCFAARPESLDGHPHVSSSVCLFGLCTFNLSTLAPKRIY
jgi:hypothetical protein